MIFKGLGIRALIYGSCPPVWESGWRADRPLVDGAGNGCLGLSSRQSPLIPSFSGTLPADLGSRLARLRRFSLGEWRGGAKRDIDSDGGFCAGGLCTGHGSVFGLGTHVGTGATIADGRGVSFVGARGLRRPAPPLLSGLKEHPDWLECSLRADRSLGGG